jgi:hypothetical protein
VLPIHNAYLGKNHKFFQIFRLKNNTLKEHFDQFVCLISAWNFGLAFKSKTVTLLHKIIPKTYVKNTSELCEQGTRFSIYSLFHTFYLIKFNLILPSFLHSQGITLIKYFLFSFDCRIFSFLLLFWTCLYAFLYLTRCIA